MWRGGILNGCSELMRHKLAAALAICAVAVASFCFSPEELRREDEAGCNGYGFKPGTNDFAACLQRESFAPLCNFAAAPSVLGLGIFGSGGDRTGLSHCGQLAAVREIGPKGRLGLRPCPCQLPRSACGR